MDRVVCNSASVLKMGEGTDPEDREIHFTAHYGEQVKHVELGQPVGTCRIEHHLMIDN